MVSLKRWEKAQEYERSYWYKVAKRIETGARTQLDWYQWKASELERRLKKFTGDVPGKRWKILEIGSGPIGIVSFLSGGERYAVDPLEDFYKSNATLTRLRDRTVTYVKGTGERIPYKDSNFSMVICDNVIDHASSPTRIIAEIYRSLAPDGILCLSLNVHTYWGKQAHAMLAKLYIDKGHPHSFTEHSVRTILAQNRFRIEGEEIENYLEIRRRNQSSNNLKDRIKGYTGLSEIQYHAVVRKTS